MNEIPNQAKQIITKLNLKPHPKEGGFFIETYRCNEKINLKSLNNRYKSDHHISTAIYYLFTPKHLSPLHKISSDEIFHFYAGDPIEMLHLFPDGSHRKILFGNNLLKDEIPQVVVPQSVWQGAKLKTGGSWALIGCTVSPGFEYEDYTHGNANELIKKFPHLKDEILLLSS